MKSKDISLKSLGITAWKMSKYGVFSGPYFPVLGLNTGKYGQEKTPYLDNFHAVSSPSKLNGDMLPLCFGI